MNKFDVIGNLTRDPELKEVGKGDKVSNIRLAISRNYKDKEGNTPADFIDFAVWNKDAERLCKLSKEGDLIQLSGNIKSKYVEIEGKNIPMIYLNVTNYTHLSKNKNQNKEEAILESKESEMEK